MPGGWHREQMPPRVKESCLGVVALECLMDQGAPSPGLKSGGSERTESNGKAPSQAAADRKA